MVETSTPLVKIYDTKEKVDAKYKEGCGANCAKPFSDCGTNFRDSAINYKKCYDNAVDICTRLELEGTDNIPAFYADECKKLLNPPVLDNLANKDFWATNVMSKNFWYDSNNKKIRMNGIYFGIGIFVLLVVMIMILK